MTRLTAQEQARFRAFLAMALVRSIPEEISRYMVEAEHLQWDIEDKGWDDVYEGLMSETDNLSFHWTPLTPD